MIRTIVVPDTSTFRVALEFPKDYLGQEVEIIAFKKEEGLSEKKQTPKKFKSFDSIKINTSNFRFNRDEANER
jgi:hypothetical protein